MTTRAHLADGTTFDIDEETEAKFTHMNDVPVLRWEYTGPTPPKAVKVPADQVDQRRAQLRAELAALGPEDDA